jgi:AMMECR1 domain-containing protein
MKSTINSAKKSRRGRPSVDTEAVNVRMTVETLGTIDNWRRQQDDLPGRPEAIRRLVDLGLKGKSK